MAINPHPSTPLPALPEQRAEPRQRTLYALGKLVHDGREHVCTVRNISDGGVGIQMAAPPPVGTQVEIELRGLARSEAQVRWVDGSHAGLALHAHPAGVTQPAPVATHTLRSPRFGYPHPVTLLIDEAEIECRGIDLALGGIKLAGPLPASLGTAATILLGSGDGRTRLRGRFCWHLPHAFALRFASPISTQQLAGLLDQASPTGASR